MYKQINFCYINSKTNVSQIIDGPPKMLGPGNCLVSPPLEPALGIGFRR